MLIKAEEIHHDKKNKTINYKNAWLEIYDQPDLFSKIFHPDPTVKDKVILIPTFSQSNNRIIILNFLILHFLKILILLLHQEFIMIIKLFIKESTGIIQRTAKT